MDESQEYEITALHFRPQSKTKTYVMRARRSLGGYTNWNLTLIAPRGALKGEPPNRRVIGRMFGHFHYYDGHAPHKVSESQAVKQRRIYWDRKMRRFGGKWNTGGRMGDRGINAWL